MYDAILVPTDGSSGSERAVERAADFAATYDATLHALYVVDDGSIPVASAGSVDDELTARGRQAIDLVEGYAADHGVPFASDIRYGDPQGEILRYVETRDIDLVVMGTHGRTGIERHLLGSVTERVVRSAPVPVVTVGLRGSVDEITAEDDARAVAREAVAEEYGPDVDLGRGAYREQHAWVFEGSAGDRHVTVYVDRATGEPHVVATPDEP
ncbi:universal stress protein [Salinigranum marinum]|uniref:universal stress protein n=1 Tax=Salinigranum marinum TaxID=1515595 RepID=UPI002989F34E|nr:universal stress protein [Salinigranum marinum]